MAPSIGSFSLTRIHVMPSTTLLLEERGFDPWTLRATHRRHRSTAAPGGHSWASNLGAEQSTPPGLGCLLRRVAAACWGTSAGSSRPSVPLPEVQRAGLLGLVLGLVIGLVIGLVLRLVVVL